MVSLPELLWYVGRKMRPARSCIARWLLLGAGAGMGSRSFTFCRRNCAGVEGVRSWLGRRTLHLRTLLSTKNVASACLRSGVTILLIFSRRYWSMGFCFVICWFCVMIWNEALSARTSV